VFQQIGTITRLLHDTMQQLGVMPKLQVAADGLPDARSRLNYIANKTAEPPTRCSTRWTRPRPSTSSDQPGQTRDLAAALTADPVRPWPAAR
jgi:chemotaxis protein CheZ